MKIFWWADFEKLQFYVSYLIKQGLEYEVKSLKQVPLNLIKSEWYQHFIIDDSGFKNLNAISFEIRSLVGLGSEEILFYYKVRNFPVFLLYGVMREHISKLIAFFFLNPPWTMIKSWFHSDIIKFRGTCLSDFTLCSKPCFIRYDT